MTEIILSKNVGVLPEHGLFRNTIWEVVEDHGKPSSHVKWWVMGDQGRLIGVLENEAEEIKVDD